MAGTNMRNQSQIPNPFERYIDSGSSAVHVTKKALASEAEASGKTFLNQLLGMEFGADKNAKSNVEVKKPEKQLTSSGIEIIDLIIFNKSTSEKQKHNAEKAPRIEAHINYGADLTENRKRASRAEVNDMQQNIQEIKAELAKLVKSSKVLNMQFTDVSVAQSTKEVGQYHTNFFEWMLIVIRQARQKVEDSGAWLNSVKGKGKKTDYSIANGKMHQSGERTTIQNAAG